MTKIRTPPHNLEMEQSVLGAVLLDNQALDRAIEILSGPVEFYNGKHRRIYQAMLDLFGRNDPIDLLTLTEALRKQNQLDDIGGTDYLADLADSLPTSANVGAHARIVREKAILRRIIQAGTEMVAAGYEPDGDALKTLDNVERMALDIAGNDGGPTIMSNVIRGGMETVEKLYKNQSLTTGLSTGYHDLDTQLAGLHPSNLIIVAGQTSMGKSAFALNVAQNIMRDEPDAVIAIFNLEMSEEELALRMLSAEAKVSGHKIRTGYLGQSDWPKLTAAAGKLHASSIYIDDTAFQGALEIRAKARRIKHKHGRLDLVIIDYLQLMDTPKSDNRVVEVSAITRSLKNLAKDLKLPVMALSQLSRKAADRDRPMLSDLRESGSIEQDADVVLFVHRPERMRPDDAALKGVAEIIVGKQRNGATGIINMTFIGEFMRFEDGAKG